MSFNADDINKWKLQLLGNSREKSDFAKDTDRIRFLYQTICDNSDPIICRDCSTILGIIAQYLPAIEPYDQQLKRVVDTLISKTSKDPDHLAQFTLPTLVNLLEANSIPSLPCSNSLSRLLAAVFLHGMGDASDSSMLPILEDSCIIAGNLVSQAGANTNFLLPKATNDEEIKNSSFYRLLTVIYRPLLRRISYITAPVFSKALGVNALSSSTKAITSESFKYQGTPLIAADMSPYTSRQLTATLALLASIFPEASYAGIKLKIPPPLLYTILSFLRCEYSSLKLEASAVIVRYAEHNFQVAGGSNAIHKTKADANNLILAAVNCLVSIADEDFFRGMGTVKNRDYRHIAQKVITFPAGIPNRLSAASLLAEVAASSDKLATRLYGLQFISKAASVAVPLNDDEDVGNKEFMESSTVHATADCIQLLAALSATADSRRMKVATYDLQSVVYDPILRHVRLCKIVKNSYDPHLHNALRLSTELALACCRLMRSLSRSAYMLRTFFFTHDVLKLVLPLLDAPSIAVYAYNVGDYQLIRSTVLLRAAALGLLANLSVGFAAIRGKIDHLSLITYINPYFKSQGEQNPSCQIFAYSQALTLLRVTAFQVARNALYAVRGQKHSELISPDFLNTVFTFCEDADSAIQRQCFNILRNASISCAREPSQTISDTPTASQPNDGLHDSAASLYKIYQSSLARKATGDKDFLAFLDRHLALSTSGHSDIPSATAICYVLVNFAAATLENKRRIMADDSLLQLLLKLLDIPISPDDSSNSDIWGLKLAIVWIITNLTWRQDTSSTTETDYQMDLGTPHTSGETQVSFTGYTRDFARKLINLGFYNIIIRLSNASPIADFQERARTAAFQLVFHEQHNNSS